MWLQGAHELESVTIPSSISQAGRLLCQWSGCGEARPSQWEQRKDLILSGLQKGQMALHLVSCMGSPQSQPLWPAPGRKAMQGQPEAPASKVADKSHVYQRGHSVVRWAVGGEPLVTHCRVGKDTISTDPPLILPLLIFWCIS